MENRISFDGFCFRLGGFVFTLVKVRPSYRGVESTISLVLVLAFCVCSFMLDSAFGGVPLLGILVFLSSFDQV